MRSAIKNLLGHGDQQQQHQQSELHGTTTAATTGTPLGHTSNTTVASTTTAAAAPIHVDRDISKAQTHVRGEVINETIKPVEVREVQPVVDVHREQKEIHQVVQPVATRQELPVQVHERLQPVQVHEQRANIPDTTRQEMATGLNIQGQRTVQGVTSTTVNKAPIIHEHIHKQVIEEIQPVIYKETIEPHVIRETVPIVEKVVEAPVIIKEVRPIATTLQGQGAPLSQVPHTQPKF